MKTKLRGTADGVALVLDEPMLDEIGLDADSEVEVIVSGRSLVVAPADDDAFRRSLEKIDEQYAGVFRRLADS